MALHTGTMGGLGQVNGSLLEANSNVGGPDPSQAPPTVSAQSQQPPPSGFMKYAAPFGAPHQGHTNPGGDPYANGGGGGMMPTAYSEESGQPQPPQLQPPPNISPNTTQQQQPPTAATPNTMQQQQQFVQSNQQQQRMIHPPPPPTAIDPSESVLLSV
ncbi:unnamed protein product [Rodentolepis nana]|uniref:LIM interaction domain-containing protein n=1 Tax=Rodentolepis nana TaxID=102285 RepID=A0A0R3TJI0_RODNA|nr:unnamed protein product [Rodentolepis nana]